jgi:hypothetical protein
MGQQKDSHFVVLIVEDDALTLMDAVEFVTEAGCSRPRPCAKIAFPVARKLERGVREGN